MPGLGHREAWVETGSGIVEGSGECDDEDGCQGSGDGTGKTLGKFSFPLFALSFLSLFFSLTLALPFPHARKHSHIRSLIHSHTCTDTFSFAHTQTHTQHTHTHTLTFMHTHRHAHLHTHTNTHTYTNTHTPLYTLPKLLYEIGPTLHH